MLDVCYVLVPCSTLEDFPKQTSDDLARGLLAAWTAPWHPRWLATTEKLPQWFRADSLPPILPHATLLVPEASRKRLPSQFPEATEAAENCCVLPVDHRADAVAALLQRLDQQQPPPSDRTADDAVLVCPESARQIAADDFYALGYTWLQVQLMTRRLRYTSNLDEIYFSGRVLAAAAAFQAGDAPTAVAAMHDAYDCLAEERDHYFSSDPHLVDLTLLAPTTLGPSLQRELDRALQADQPPANFLIDTALAQSIAASDHPPCVRLMQLIDEDRVGLAGGGPDPDVNLHHLTAATAAQEIMQARQRLVRLLGDRVRVYARSSGETTGDIGPWLAEAGFRGAIPIDLAAGSGWKDESKLIWQSGANPLDALVAKPIDASQSVGFLALAPNLGQSVDSGEIATALLVHWPDAHSDAYRDLRRATSWGLALGRFWKIDDFFSDGERPFHHYRGRADEGSGNWLRRAVDANLPNPLSDTADRYHQQLRHEAASTIDALTALINPAATADQTQNQNPSKTPPPSGGGPDGEDHADSAASQSHHAGCERLRRSGQALCRALGGQPAPLEPTSGHDQAAGQAGGHGRAGGHNQPTGGTAPPATRQLLINPHPISLRASTPISGGPGNTAAGLQSQLFHWSQTSAGHCVATVDIAGGGFLSLDGSHSPPRASWFKRRRKLASGNALSNEFLEVEISPTSGGVQAVYSGSQRGNRYSLRLVANGITAIGSATDAMVAQRVELIQADETLGQIRSSGQLLGSDGQLLADFIVNYRLQRGSRWLEVETTLQPTEQLLLDHRPWRSHVAWRSAFSSESYSLQTPLRDKLYRISHSKQIDSPAGLLVDEVDRTTLIYSGGYPAHQPTGNRFIDSLILVRGETRLTSTLAIGFDVKAALPALRARAVPPLTVPVERNPTTATGWLLHCGTPDVLVTDLRVESQQPLVLSMLVIDSCSDSRKARLRFCRNVVDAQRLTDNPHQPEQAVPFKADEVDLPLAGYETARLKVTFA